MVLGGLAAAARLGPRQTVGLRLAEVADPTGHCASTDVGALGFKLWRAGCPGDGLKRAPGIGTRHEGTR